MSIRSQPEIPTEDVNITKRPRLDIQEQIKRAGVLAEQLRNPVDRDGLDSKATAANQIASEELVRIIESMQEQTADTSESVDGLITSSIKLEVKVMMDYLSTKARTFTTTTLWKQVLTHLQPDSQSFRDQVIQSVQKKMEGVKSGDYVSKINETVKLVLVEEMQKGVGNELNAIMP